MICSARNANSYTSDCLPDGSETAAGTLTVDVRVTESAFYVADNGIGIPDERRKRLFDLEYADSDAGYGLYIVSTLVEAHGWDISVTDSDSGGARFEISGVETPGTDCS
ncbi:sensor histidine kinase [Halapricum hydrolyticum]|uniref:histidine kinase n=1 Tax=Halapricum hydrolyticum TaxID=2979991 RepID=A0AAE3LIB2_9EURY|nr:sensor histidine kinase [Halapricum hydrolyticum]MCU4718767.1 sensor histidine kinase [Halapricum hydrolyticum]MCU4727754.1 sensor histidine kinase [Halapricum hydrolyticum]